MTEKEVKKFNENLKNKKVTLDDIEHSEKYGVKFIREGEDPQNEKLDIPTMVHGRFDTSTFFSVQRD